MAAWRWLRNLIGSCAGCSVGVLRGFGQLLGRNAQDLPQRLLRQEWHLHSIALEAPHARSLLKKRGKKEFKTSFISKRQWQVKNSKGWGRRAKKLAFRQWYDREIQSRNCVYVFWSGKDCEYVGRTFRGKERPTSSFDKFWFNGVTRIDIYSVHSPSVVARAECLAIDVFDPRRNLNSSSRPKFSKRCPIVQRRDKSAAN